MPRKSSRLDGIKEIFYWWLLVMFDNIVHLNKQNDQLKISDFKFQTSDSNKNNKLTLNRVQRGWINFFTYYFDTKWNFVTWSWTFSWEVATQVFGPATSHCRKKLKDLSSLSVSRARLEYWSRKMKFSATRKLLLTK